MAPLSIPQKVSIVIEQDILFFRIFSKKKGGTLVKPWEMIKNNLTHSRIVRVYSRWLSSETQGRVGIKLISVIYVTIGLA